MRSFHESTIFSSFDVEVSEKEVVLSHSCLWWRSETRVPFHAIDAVRTRSGFDPLPSFLAVFMFFLAATALTLALGLKGLPPNGVGILVVVAAAFAVGAVVLLWVAFSTAVELTSIGGTRYTAMNITGVDARPAKDLVEAITKALPHTA